MTDKYLADGSPKVVFLEDVLNRRFGAGRSQPTRIFNGRIDYRTADGWRLQLDVMNLIQQQGQSEQLRLWLADQDRQPLQSLLPRSGRTGRRLPERPDGHRIAPDRAADDQGHAGGRVLVSISSRSANANWRRSATKIREWLSYGQPPIGLLPTLRRGPLHRRRGEQAPGPFIALLPRSKWRTQICPAARSGVCPTAATLW
jgi:hypothetical protein